MDLLVPLVVTVVHMLSVGANGCAVMPVITPSRIVVPHGSPLSANCSLCGESVCLPVHWEVPRRNSSFTPFTDDRNKTTVQWNHGEATEWQMKPQCAAFDATAVCLTYLSVTLYKPPDNVSIGLVDHSGPLLEGHRYSLQCLVQDVAPVQNLTVTFYRGHAALGSAQYSVNPVMRPVTETFNISIISSREDDGVQYWCEAVLDLGPHGPQPAPVRTSERLVTTVHFKPVFAAASGPHQINITEGETLQLNCTASSNPSAAYSWVRPPQNQHLGSESVLTVPSAGSEQGGPYVCVASNDLGSVSMTFNVRVSVDHLPIIAGAVAVFLFVAAVIGAAAYTCYYRRTRRGKFKLLNRVLSGGSDGWRSCKPC